MTLSTQGSLKPSPGWATATIAPLRSTTPRSPWSMVYQLPKMVVRPMIAATAMPTRTMILRKLLFLLAVDVWVGVDADVGDEVPKPSQRQSDDHETADSDEEIHSLRAAVAAGS